MVHQLNILILRGVAQFGSARGLGPWGRGFESLHLDQYMVGIAQLVKRQIVALEVVSSTLIIHPIKR